MKIAKITLVFLLVIMGISLAGCTNNTSAVSSYGSSCDECQNDLDGAQQKINDLESCNEELKSTLNEINSDASFNAWSDYNSMGDALDEIEYKSASFNFCD